MADAKIIRAKLRRLLPTLDLETATQRTIQQQLEDELGIPLDEYKSLIKQETDAWLLGLDPEAADNAAAEAAEPSEEPPAKKPRQESQQQPAGPPNAGTAGVGPGDFSYSAPISSMRYAGVKSYKGKGMVDIREFYDKDGVLAPGAKGLAMNTEQWKKFTAGMMEINTALEHTDASFYLDLGSNKRATISLLGGKVMVSLREHYEKDGKMLPGKKGISLPPDQWMKVCAVHEELTAKLEAQFGASSGAGASGYEGRKAEAAAAGGSGGGATGGSANAILSIPLATMRRAEVVNWKESRVVDVREFYEKDGALAHSKKGLQLTSEQFEKFRNGAAGLTAALGAQDTSFEIMLAPKRKATISSFKGKYSVDLREYYEKNGQLAPTPKGIALNPEQWGKLEAALPSLAEALMS